MKLEIRLTVDFAFKLTIGNPKHPDITRHFIQSILNDPDPVRTVEYLNPTISREARAGKLSQLDIRLRDDRGRQLNIEMQASAPARASTWCSCRFSRPTSIMWRKPANWSSGRSI